MFFSSKALGIYICEKIKKDKEEKTAIGFLANLSLFFICELAVMFFKLSTTYLNIFGLVYLVIVGLIIFKYIKNKKIIKITKKEIVALVLAFTFVLLYIHMSTDLRKILSICLFTHGCGAVATAHGGKRICLLAIAYPAART